ncbi:condensation domain-containing protein [Streptomyces sp. NPDC059122]|uniref:condensation domain-containing protein n=1 Tax=Streptomyces sp. NPDC059122 TaxID=3346732 RepID=UPI0036A7444B
MNRTVAAGATPRDPRAQPQQHPQSPLTAYQRDIWAAGSQAPQSPQFNCVLHESLRGPVDHEVLARCVEHVLHRHTTFRLRFAEHAGRPLQWVADEAIRVGRIDLSHEPEPQAACAEWMRRSMATALPLTEGGGLVEATLLLEGPDVTHLHVKAHHIVADGWTINRVSHEITEDYARATGAGGQGAADPCASSSYLALIEEEAAYRAGAAGDRDRAFHREALAGVEPALFTRTPGGDRHGRHSFVVEQVRAAGLAPFAYVAAMFGTWLTRLHRSPEAVLGVPFLNRPESHHKDTLGQFANTLPLRLPAHGGRTVRELVADTQQSIVDLRHHERLSLGDVLRELPSTAGGPRQLFDVTLSVVKPGAIATPIWRKVREAGEKILNETPHDIAELYRLPFEEFLRMNEQRAQSSGTQPEDFARTVFRALTSAQPRTRYCVGNDARTAALLSRLLPDAALDRGFHQLTKGTSRNP